MRRGQQSPSIDLAIRAGGLALLGVGGLAVDALSFRSAAEAMAPSITLLALCALAFLGLSLGAALLTLGSHLLDEVELSGRWARPTAKTTETGVGDN